jgi:uncharacterized protein YdaU (DUF1376 family)
MAQAPWFKMFAADFLSDNYVDAMTAEQIGWYTLLLLRSWNHTPRGFLPNDKQLLAVWCRCADAMSFEKRAGIVLDRFEKTSDGRMIYHPRLLEQSSKVKEVSEKRSLAGRLGGVKSSQQKLERRQAIAKQVPTDSDSDSDIKEREIEPLGEDRDEKIFEVFRSHPANAHLRTRLEIPHDQMVAIIDAVSRDGFDLVVSGTRNLADAVALWPKLDRRFIPNPVKFFRDSEYLKDPSTWDRSMSAKPSVGTKLRKANLDDLYPQEEVNAKA